MASSFGSVGSVLTEQPPADSDWGIGVRPRHNTGEHVSVARPAPALIPDRHPAPDPLPPLAPQPAQSQPSQGNRAWYDSMLSGRQYEVVYDDAQGYPLLAFADGQWYDVTSVTPRPVSVRHAVQMDPAWAGALVQTVCMWMRTNPTHDRSLELATEMALAMGELARLAR